ncbi:hypothetical protein BD779DRAFT_1787382 [Infundibulicybe gibba]|nr:hypothetical protein BD779DRAFT_1787382 [Infundibulicybe gibba]
MSTKCFSGFLCLTGYKADSERPLTQASNTPTSFPHTNILTNDIMDSFTYTIASVEDISTSAPSNEENGGNGGPYARYWDSGRGWARVGSGQVMPGVGAKAPYYTVRIASPLVACDGFEVEYFESQLHWLCQRVASDASSFQRRGLIPMWRQAQRVEITPPYRRLHVHNRSDCKFPDSVHNPSLSKRRGTIAAETR